VEARCFLTPLGQLAVDADFANDLLQENPDFKFLPEVFQREHAIEVELPFLQKTFGNIKIVPILMGEGDFKLCQALAQALDKIIAKRQDVLVLISSDMSHYHPYAEATRMDAGTLEAVKNNDAQGFYNACLAGSMEMCGFMPVTTALIYAKLRGLKHTEVLNMPIRGHHRG